MSYFKQYRPTKGITPAVLNLIALNVIFFIAKQFALRSDPKIYLDNILGMHHVLSPDFHWFQLITYMFMHADPMHLVMNMLGLYFFGKLLETVWGVKRFLIFYFVCGIGSSLIFIGWETFTILSSGVESWAALTEISDYAYALPNTDPVYHLLFTPMVGASGAIFGLLAGAALLFPNTVVELYLWFMIPIRLKIKWIAILYGLYEVLSGISLVRGDNVAHFAHIGGMIFGFILVQIYKRSRNNFY